MKLKKKQLPLILSLLIVLFDFKNDNNNFTGPNYDLTDTNHYEDNIFNALPNFKDTDLNMLIIGEESAAINRGLQTFAATSTYRYFEYR